MLWRSRTERPTPEPNPNPESPSSQPQIQAANQVKEQRQAWFKKEIKPPRQIMVCGWRKKWNDNLDHLYQVPPRLVTAQPCT